MEDKVEKSPEQEKTSQDDKRENTLDENNKDPTRQLQKVQPSNQTITQSSKETGTECTIEGISTCTAPDEETKSEYFKAIRISLVVASFLVFISGIAIFAVGVWILSNPRYIIIFLENYRYKASANLLIVTGVLTSAASVLGYWATMDEKKTVLIRYFILLFVLFFLMLIGGIIIYVNRDKLCEEIQNEMIQTIPLYSRNTKITNSWNIVQEQFKCCGTKTEDHTENWEAWGLLHPGEFNSTGKLVPASCCRQKDLTSLDRCQSNPNEINVFRNDCFKQLCGFARKQASDAGAAGIGLSFILIATMILICLFLKLLKAF